MEIFGQFFEKMKDLDFHQEFQGYDKQQLAAIIQDRGLAGAKPAKSSGARA